jgi:hypothetical protein
MVATILFPTIPPKKISGFSPGGKGLLNGQQTAHNAGRERITPRACGQVRRFIMDDDADDISPLFLLWEEYAEQLENDMSQVDDWDDWFDEE